MSFDERLRQSLYLQRPIEAGGIMSLNESMKSRKILARLEISPLKFRFEHTGEGNAEFSDGGVTLRARVIRDEWPESQKPDGDYCNFGSVGVRIALGGESFEGYNRLTLKVFPRFDGGRALNMTISAINAETGFTDGLPCAASHEANLDNYRMNTVIWEFPDLHRDALTELDVDFPLNGMDTACSEFAEYDILEIAAEKAERTEKFLGWGIDGSGIAVSSVYLSEGNKSALSQRQAEFFTVCRGGRTVLKKAPTALKTMLGEFWELDFSALSETGDYTVEYAGASSAVFRIADNYDELKWKLLNFIYSERCGCPVPGKHGTCHTDITAEHLGRTLVYNGGWHDAGDLSQQTLQTGEIAAILSGSAKGGGLLAKRLICESEWGLEFILRTRFGDGFRASSAGATRWTKGLIGDMDDIRARVHDQAFQNYLLSACEAGCFVAESESDPALASKLKEAAESDFEFAERRFASHGVEKPIVFEHSYSSSLSLHHAAAALAASKIALMRTAAKLQSPDYRRAAEWHLDYLTSCQENSGGLCGYFCRDESKKQPVHFNHQSREHLFADALITALEAFPDSPEAPKWHECVLNYGDYLKKLARYTAPYGMLPSGVYYEDEADDRETFELSHLFTDYDRNRESLTEQIKKGEPLGNGRYLKRFPAWFAFRGNFAVCLSQSAAARRIAGYTGDRELSTISDESVCWILGKNPFCRSFVYGEGENCVRQYAPLLGETIGEIPVGIKTAGNDDEPYMPVTADATYAEVWTSSAARLLLSLG